MVLVSYKPHSIHRTLKTNRTSFWACSRHTSLPWVLYLQLAANSHRLKTGYNALISPPLRGGFAMVSHLFFYQLVLIALVWLCVMLQWAWPSDPAAAYPTTLEPTPPPPKRHREPTPFAGLTTKPHCASCEHALEH